MKWFFNIGNLAKAFGAIIALGITLYSVKKGYDAWVINKNNKEVTQQTIVTELRSLNVKVDSIGAGLVVLNARTTEIKSVVDEHTKGMKRLENSHKSLLKDLGKIDLLLQYYEEETLKKNSYMNEIVLEPNSIWTPLVLK